jgi:asparagine synthase (glutamine-hydrolysing)
MDRFVAMIWGQDDPSRQRQVFAWSETLQRQSPKWKCVLDRPGLRVFSYHHRGDAPVVTRWQGDNGIVIGVLFERGQEKKGRVQSLDPRAAGRVIASRGDELIKKYWGNYLALWRNPETREATVLRDPCGAVPCFMTRQQGVELLFAHMEDVADLPGLSFTVDWEYLKAYLLFNYFVTEHTGFNEVKELLGGERSEYRGSAERQRSWAWNGAEIAAAPSKQSFDDAKAELRATVTDCFTAWGKEYRNIALQMSGGLDSSILANLLRRVSDAQIHGLHHLGPGYERKDVREARLAAAHAGIALTELPVDSHTNDLGCMFEAPRLARPTGEVMLFNIREHLVETCARVGADCLMAGHGADNLLLQRGIAQHMLTDYVRLNGLRRDFWRIAYGAAVLRLVPIWRVLHDVLNVEILHASWQPFPFLDQERIMRHRLLNQEAIDSISDGYKFHPWFASASKLPRGKADHLRNIIALSNYHHVCGDCLERDVLMPYVSQPIAEFALRTPTYVLVREGFDRALERAAFGDLIPNAIARRTQKGTYAIGQLESKSRNITLLRGLILDGEIIDRGWLDKGKTEQALTREHLVHGGAQFFIDNIVACEAWLASWRSDGARAAA